MLRKKRLRRWIEAAARDQGHITDSATEDPFAGSGSTLIAARRLSRSYIGIEIDARYSHEAARQFSGGCSMMVQCFKFCF